MCPDLLDDRGSATKKRVALHPCSLLDRDRLAEPIERAAIFQVDVVFEELAGALADMRVDVDER